jgi:hypothetical protein
LQVLNAYVTLGCYNDDHPVAALSE